MRQQNLIKFSCLTVQKTYEITMTTLLTPADLLLYKSRTTHRGKVLRFINVRVLDASPEPAAAVYTYNTPPAANNQSQPLQLLLIENSPSLPVSI